VPRIAVDATPVTARATGAGRAIRNLLATLPAVDPGRSYLALVTEEGARAVEHAAPDVELHVVASGRGLAWELRCAAGAAAEHGADLLFTVRELVGAGPPPTVLHVFEPPAYRLRAGRAAGLRRTAKDALLAALLGRSLRRAAAVTAGSATTAAWLRAHHGIEATVVLPGIDDAFFETDGAAATAAPYLLHLGSGDARDRTDVVVAALARLADAAPLLRVAGLGEAGRAEFVRLAEERGVGARVEALGWVTDDELRALYRGALAYVHASRYESYGGFPALEAMALGTPVVAFDAPGVTEALTGAAILVERADAEGLAAGIRELAHDPALRARLADAGRQRVEPLRWSRAARDLAAVFARVLAQ
jgi:glycosyltransferase involved in cell wall biosynthesis